MGVVSGWPIYMFELLTLGGSHNIQFLGLLPLVFLPTPSASQADNTTLPITYSANSVECSEQLRYSGKIWRALNLAISAKAPYILTKYYITTMK